MAVAVALVLVAGIVTAALLASEDESPTAAPSAASPTTTPSSAPPETEAPTPEPEPAEGSGPDAASGVDEAELQAAVAELSAFVAESRGAPFPAPVTVELLAQEQFNERLLDDFEEDRADIDLVGRLFVAMGLLEADQDLYEILREFLGAGVVGFYDPETGELVVRGDALTPYTRSTLVHELVHAYDDQRFELDRPALDDADDESALGFSSLVEGNAVRVQQAWEATSSTRGGA